MTSTIHVAATILVALAAALSVAHALEYPGKMRLDREQYFVVQQIYYPGFTIGAAKPLGTLAMLALLFLVPFSGTEFWLVFVALIAMLGVMAVFWLITQPANKLWTKYLKMGRPHRSSFRPVRVRPRRQTGRRCGTAGNGRTLRAPRSRRSASSAC